MTQIIKPVTLVSQILSLAIEASILSCVIQVISSPYPASPAIGGSMNARKDRLWHTTSPISQFYLLNQSWFYFFCLVVLALSSTDNRFLWWRYMVFWWHYFSELSFFCTILIWWIIACRKLSIGHVESNLCTVFDGLLFFSTIRTRDTQENHKLSIGLLVFLQCLVCVFLLRLTW